ncbi:hypothetical protein ACFPRL_09955 [Pseudoclavibacter helvolus]
MINRPSDRWASGRTRTMEFWKPQPVRSSSRYVLRPNPAPPSTIATSPARSSRDRNSAGENHMVCSGRSSLRPFG